MFVLCWSGKWFKRKKRENVEKYTVELSNNWPMSLFYHGFLFLLLELISFVFWWVLKLSYFSWYSSSIFCQSLFLFEWFQCLQFFLTSGYFCTNQKPLFSISVLWRNSSLMFINILLISPGKRCFVFVSRILVVSIPIFSIFFFIF